MEGRGKGRREERKEGRKQGRNELFKKKVSFLFDLSHSTLVQNVLMTCLCLISLTLPPICHLI